MKVFKIKHLDKILKYISLIGIVVFLFVFFKKLIFNEGTCLDDACMYVRYADNILNEYGYTWNRGESPTFGCTSIIYTYFILLLRSLFFFLSPTAILTCSSAFFALLSLVSFFILIKTVILDVRPILIIPIILILGFQPIFLIHSFTGMDTMFSIFINTVFLIFLVHGIIANKKAVQLFSSIFAYFAFLARPDSAILVSLTPLLLMLIYKRGKNTFLHFYFVFGLLMLTDLIVKYHFFGDPIPLPFYAKREEYFKGYLAAHLINPFSYLTEFIVYISPLCILTSFFINKRNLNYLLLFIPVFISICLSFGFIQIMGENGRFYFPTLPFIILTLTLLADNNYEKQIRLSSIVLTSAISVSLILITVFILKGQGAIWSEKTKRREEKESHPIADSYLPEMSWLESSRAIDRLCKKLPDNTLITASEHGFIAAYNPKVRILDLIGLHDPFVAKNGFSVSYLMKKRPVIVWLAHKDYTSLNHALITSNQFKQEYYFIPKAFAYGIAVLKENKEVQSILLKELRHHYPNFQFSFH